MDDYQRQVDQYWDARYRENDPLSLSEEEKAAALEQIQSKILALYGKAPLGERLPRIIQIAKDADSDVATICVSDLEALHRMMLANAQP